MTPRVPSGARRRAGPRLALALLLGLLLATAGCEDLLGAQGGACTFADEDQLKELLDRSLDLAKRAALGIRSGHIAPLPDRECPGWCRLGPVCRAKKGSGAW